MANELALRSIIPETKVIARVRERHYEGQKGPESLDALCEYLSSKTECKIFNVIIENLHKVRICCSIMTAAADDDGETRVSINKDGTISGIEDVEIPNLKRFSMMFYPYIFEGVKVAYYQSRIGMKYERDENWLVLPYFVTLYAIENSKELFDPKVIDAAMSLYIDHLYSALTSGVESVRTAMKVLLGVEDEINPIANIVGITKAVTLYEMAKKDGNFDDILRAVIDNSKSISKELNYDAPELYIRSDNVISCCRKFIQENAKCLRDVDEPDEYEPIEFVFTDY